MKFQNNRRILELDDELINAITIGLEQTFETLLNTKIAKRLIPISEVKNYSREVTSIIGFVQDSLEGTLSISFKRTNALKCFGSIFNENIEGVDERILGGIGEIVNMVYGLAKERLNPVGYNFQLCLPMAIVSNGGALSFESIIKEGAYDSQAIIFETPQWDFIIDVTVYDQKKAQSKKWPLKNMKQIKKEKIA